MPEGLHQVGEGMAVELLEGLLGGADRPPLVVLPPWVPTRVSAVDQLSRSYGSGESSSAEPLTFKPECVFVCPRVHVCVCVRVCVSTEFICWNENAKGVIRWDVQRFCDPERTA